MTNRAAAESPSSTESERSFRVGLRVDTGVYFPQDETLTVRNFPSELGRIDVVFSTNRLPAEGFAHPTCNEWTTAIVPALQSIPLPYTAQRMGLSERSIQNVLQGTSVPHPRNRQRYCDVLSAWSEEAR